MHAALAHELTSLEEASGRANRIVSKTVLFEKNTPPFCETVLNRPRNCSNGQYRMSCPEIKIRPCCASRRRDSKCCSVVLPIPERPVTPITEPGWIERLNWLSTGSPCS